MAGEPRRAALSPSAPPATAMPRRRPPSLPASIAALLRRLLRPVVPGDASSAGRARRKPLTVIGQLPGTKRLRAANDPHAR